VPGGVDCRELVVADGGGEREAGGAAFVLLLIELEG